MAMSTELVSLFQNLSILPVGIVTALASGFMAYYTGYAGLRRGHSSQDALFISIVFGLAALVVYQEMQVLPSTWRIVIAFAVTITLSVVWRKWLRTGWNSFMRWLGVHRDDGVYGAWDVIADKDLAVGQISVHTKDGRILYLDNRLKYENEPWQGIYLGSDGSISMIVEREELPDGTIEERKEIISEEWGARLTYIPASEICRVNIRMQ